MSIQQQKRRRRFNSFKRKTRRVRDPRRARAVHRRAAHGFEHRFFKSIAHGLDAAFPVCEIFRGEFGCFPKADNRRHVFRSTPATIFLAAASDQRTEAGSPVDIKRADAFWSMKFVRGKRKKIDRRIAQAHRDFPGSLHGVGMKKHTFPATYFSDLLNRKQHARLVVRPHHRNERGLRANLSFQFGEIDIAISVNA